MMHTAQNLYDNLGRHLLELNKQLDAVQKDVEKSIGVLPYPDQVSVYDMKTRDGRPVLAELMVAKAQVLSAMANLKVSTEAPASRRTR